MKGRKILHPKKSRGRQAIKAEYELERADLALGWHATPSGQLDLHPSTGTDHPHHSRAILGLSGLLLRRVLRRGLVRCPSRFLPFACLDCVRFVIAIA